MADGDSVSVSSNPVDEVAIIVKPQHLAEMDVDPTVSPGGLTNRSKQTRENECVNKSESPVVGSHITELGVLSNSEMIKTLKDNVNVKIQTEAAVMVDSNRSNEESEDVHVVAGRNGAADYVSSVQDVADAVGTVETSSVAHSADLSSLSQLCAYDSDSDSDSAEEGPGISHPVEFENNYRTSMDVMSADSEEDSEDNEDSSSTTTTTTSSSSTSTPVALTDESDSDSDLNDLGKPDVIQNSLPRTKGELTLKDLPPIEDLHISVPEEYCMEIGHIESIVDTLVVVQAKKDIPALDLDSVLFLDRGSRPLGQIFDVFGPVTEPCYCIRFNSAEHITERGIQKDMPVYCAPQTEHSLYVFLPDLLKMKGSDASWEHNNEPPPRFVEFSDDEEERRARRPERNQNKTYNEVDASQSSKKKRSNYERRMNSRNLRMSAANPPPPSGDHPRTWRGPWGLQQVPLGSNIPASSSMSPAPLIRPPSFNVPPPRIGTPLSAAASPVFSNLPKPNMPPFPSFGQHFPREIPPYDPLRPPPLPPIYATPHFASPPRLIGPNPPPVNPAFMHPPVHHRLPFVSSPPPPPAPPSHW